MLALPAGAMAAEQTASRGEVRAVLSYEETQNSFDFEEVRLDVTHSEVFVYGHDFHPICKACALAPAGYGEGRALWVKNLDPDPDPEILTEFYTGGAHCCVYIELFDWDGSSTYDTARHNFRDSGYRLSDRDGDGLPEFLSSDARFAYRWDCFACSRFPVNVFRFRGGELVDVTGRFPALVKRQIRELTSDYRADRGKRNVRAILAALVADRCTIGQREKAYALLRKARLAGYLDKQDESDAFGPYGRKYVKSLKGLLRHFDYC